MNKFLLRDKSFFNLVFCKNINISLQHTVLVKIKILIFYVRLEINLPN